MTFFVFNTQSGKQRLGDYESEISEEILYRGTREEFKMMGFNESQIGGFKLVNGILSYDEALKQSAISAQNKKNRRAEIEQELEKLDKKAIRNLREPDAIDPKTKKTGKQYLAEQAQIAAALRDELKTLQ